MRQSQESQPKPRDAGTAATGESSSVNAAAVEAEAEAAAASDRRAPSPAALPVATSTKSVAVVSIGHASADVATGAAEQVSQPERQLGEQLGEQPLLRQEKTDQYLSPQSEVAADAVRPQLQSAVAVKDEGKPCVRIAEQQQQQRQLPQPAMRVIGSIGGGSCGMIAARQSRKADGTACGTGNILCGDQVKIQPPGAVPPLPPAAAEEYIVRVRGQVMERDKATDLWAPVRHYPWCIVGLLQKHPVSSSVGVEPSHGQAPDASSAAEYIIRGRRLHDSQEVICCNVDAGLHYSVANPTFHHWTTVADDGSSRGGCGGVLFVNASDAARFEKHVRRALSHVSSGHAAPPKTAPLPVATEAAGAAGADAVVAPLGSSTCIAAAALPVPFGAPVSNDKPWPRLPVPVDVTRAAAVNGRVVPAAIEDGCENNNWPSTLPDGKVPVASRTTRQQLPEAAAASGRGLFMVQPRVMPVSREDAGVWTVTKATVHGCGSSAMHDYRTGEMPRSLAPLPVSSVTPAVQSRCRWSPSHVSDHREHRLQRAAGRDDGAGQPTVVRDYRHTEAIEAQDSLSASDSHLELKLPVRAKPPGGRKYSRCFASPRTWLSRRRPLNSDSASMDRDAGSNSKGTQGARGQVHSKGKDKPVDDFRSHRSRRCCCYTGDDGVAQSSDSECDDDAPCAAPSLRTTGTRKKNAGSAGCGLLRLLCCCVCLPGSAHRRLHSSGGSSSSARSDRQGGRQPTRATVTASPPPARRHATTANQR